MKRAKVSASERMVAATRHEGYCMVFLSVIMNLTDDAEEYEIFFASMVLHCTLCGVGTNV